MASRARTTTTTTQQWILVKYSRSRIAPDRPPPAKRARLEHAPEFDHFVQPQLSLRLETTRSLPADAPAQFPITHSMQLSVEYDPRPSASSRHHGTSSAVQTLKLDSLDLISFSSPLVRTHCPRDELPLKGVYKDETLGLRYVDVDLSRSNQKSEFKRVQFRFESIAERERFMTSVQGIIPFKPAESSTSTRFASGAATNARQQVERRIDPSTIPTSRTSYSARRSSATPSTTEPSRLMTASQRAARLERLQEDTPLGVPPTNAPLPARLSSLLPNLSSQVDRERWKSRSRALVAMDPDGFRRLLEDVLFEDGFDELVESVQNAILDLRGKSVALNRRLVLKADLLQFVQQSIVICSSRFLVVDCTQLKPVSSRQLVGHLGHLTPEQEKTLEHFRERLERDGYYTRNGPANAPSHDDVTLVRFLRARKFDLEGALSQFTAAEDWRRENDVDNLYDEFPLSEFDLAANLYPQWTGRRDKTGLPVYVFKVSSLTKKATDDYAKDPTRLNPRMIALYEHMVQFVLPFCSSIPHAHQEVPISGCATIVDISNVSLMRFWQLKSHMQRASALASANYAETLGAIYLVGAPNFFSTVWGWIKNWFDPGTVEKIFILPSHSVLTTLSTHIDPSSIPKEFGGELDWSYGCRIPNLDREAKEMLGLEQVPEGPLRWLGKDRGVVLKGTGRDQQVERDIEHKLASRRNSLEERQQEPKQETRTPTSDQHPTVRETSEPTSTTVAPTATDETVKQSFDAPPPVGMAQLAPPASTTLSIDGPAAERTSTEAAEHDITVAARENPSAPIKDLAATLEGTTL
ncbi:uncharacterized protein JCM15063_004545 [Sporobolomyces koalae]|uniref:uncharacterized protein n=1 Tax=Sporobolomyces koalae TaxID=500713 RepID=UPI00317705AA